MKLSEALTKLKNLKSKIARTETYLASSVVHYEDQQPEYVFKDELATRCQLAQDILNLKTQIQVTNAVSKVTYKGQSVTIAGLILLNADLRSELAFWSKQLGYDLNVSLYEARTRDQLKKVFADGYNKADIRAKIDSLEADREELESALASANLSTDLVEV